MREVGHHSRFKKSCDQVCVWKGYPGPSPENRLKEGPVRGLLAVTEVREDGGLNQGALQRGLL